MRPARALAWLAAAVMATAGGGCERVPEVRHVAAAMTDTASAATAAPLAAAPVPGARPDPMPGARPDLLPGARPNPMPGARPDLVPDARPDPVPATERPVPASPGGASLPVLWGYIDGAGTAYFADHQVDSRYSQVLRETEGPRVPGKRDGPESLLTWLEISPAVRALDPLVADAARRTGVDRELLEAVIAVESGYDAHAVSPRGAVGLMQLTPGTADRYATAAERQEPARVRMLDARINILTGARMLADLTRRYGGIDVALAAWNAGEGTVRRAGGRIPAIAETEAHVHMVLELYWALLQRSLPGRAHRVVIAEPARIRG